MTIGKQIGVVLPALESFVANCKQERIDPGVSPLRRRLDAWANTARIGFVCSQAALVNFSEHPERDALGLCVAILFVVLFNFVLERFAFVVTEIGNGAFVVFLSLEFLYQLQDDVFHRLFAKCANNAPFDLSDNPGDVRSVWFQIT